MFKMNNIKSVILILVSVIYIFSMTLLIEQNNTEIVEVDISSTSLRPRKSDSYERDSDNFVEIDFSEDPILSLSRLAAVPPPSPPHPSCSPPPLPHPPSCAGQPGLTGAPLTRPRSLVLMILFGFEVDTLEIALKEQIEFLDKIFIVEATTTTKGV